MVFTCLYYSSPTLVISIVKQYLIHFKYIFFICVYFYFICMYTKHIYVVAYMICLFAHLCC